MAKKAEARGQNLGPGFCVLGLLGFGLWTLDVKVASCSRCTGSGGPEVRRGCGGPLGYL